MKKHIKLFLPGLLFCLMLFHACSDNAPAPESAPPTVFRTEAVQAVPNTDSSPLFNFKNAQDSPKEPFISEKAGRYYSDVTLNLIAKSDYGMIYPYIGGLSRTDFSGTVNYLYGVVDGGGRIICDPVYNKVSTVNTPSGDEIYLFRKYGKAADENYEIGGLFVFAALDGSWVRKFENAHFADFSGEKIIYDYIAVCSDGKWGAIDYNGNDILPCEYMSPPLFHEGLAPVLTDDGQSYVYIDENGQSVLGPYNRPPELQKMFGHEDNIILEKMFFNNGRALYFEGNKYGFIDKSGKIIIQPQFEEAFQRRAFENGYAVVMKTVGNSASGKYGVINVNGDYAIPMEMDYIGAWSEGKYICDKNNNSYIYSADGSFVRNDDSDDIGGGWSEIIGAGYITIKGHGQEVTFEKAHRAVYLEGDKFIISYSEPYIERIQDMDGKIYLEIKNNSLNLSASGDKIFTYSWNDSFANQLQIYENCGVLDFDGNVIIPAEYNYLEAFGENYLATQGIYAGLLNKKGDWIIKVSVLDYIPD